MEGVDKTWARAHGPAHGLPYGLPYGLPSGLPCGLPVKLIFFDKNKKNNKHKKNKLKINFLLIYQLLAF